MRLDRRALVALATVVLVVAGWWLAGRGGRDDSALRGGPSVTTNGPVAPSVSVAVLAQPTTPDGLATVARSALPPEGRATLALIDSGGPFPYDADGDVFQNREGLLPDAPPGYYREYTVVTPGSDDRGARRIVAGTGGERFYTDDHYDTFRVVTP